MDDEKATRRVMPVVCVTDGKHHVRKFLREALSEFSFAIYECVEVGELSPALDARPPDLVILGLTAGGIAASEMLRTLAAKNFDGKVLPFAQRDSAVIGTIHDLAEQLGISLLPPLLVPFSNERLRESIANIAARRLIGTFGGHGRGRARGLARTLVSTENRCTRHGHAWR